MSETSLLGLDFAPPDLPRTRIALVVALQRAGLPEPRRGMLVQAVLEAVTNALVHGGGRGRLTVTRVAGEVRCEVTDSGPGFAHPARERDPRNGSRAGSGHGLLLAEALTERLELRPGPGNRGTTVTLAVPLTGPAVPER